MKCAAVASVLMLTADRRLGPRFIAPTPRALPILTTPARGPGALACRAAARHTDRVLRRRGTGNITTHQQAEQELTKYGYNGVHDLKSMQGWSADAMRNGERVHVILGDNGLVATFPGTK